MTATRSEISPQSKWLLHTLKLSLPNPDVHCTIVQPTISATKTVAAQSNQLSQQSRRFGAQSILLSQQSKWLLHTLKNLSTTKTVAAQSTIQLTFSTIPKIAAQSNPGTVKANFTCCFDVEYVYILVHPIPRRWLSWREMGGLVGWRRVAKL